ncbi:hypothetical protein [Desulfotomaculum sp. 1211_IL3151]|uniref:hypothetical protein n=1 Tax=Desulfotomaculum sp. 1211_IL3151 TaxID=3084055 RepID=UPI002FDB2D54
MKSSQALRLFGLCVNGLIDLGHTEKIEDIEREMAKESILEYLSTKYSQTGFFSELVEGAYKEQALALNNLFSQWSGYIEGNECRRFWVKKSGLTLLSSLCLEMLSESDRKD